MSTVPEFGLDTDNSPALGPCKTAASFVETHRQIHPKRLGLHGY